MVEADFRGAESKLFRGNWLGTPVIFKKRLPKSYRIKELDFYFRKQRTMFEARLLTKSKEAGVRVPLIYEIDLLNTILVLEYIEGNILKLLLPRLSKNERKRLCLQIGRNIGLLHKNGIIHGDLTTSNMILSSQTKQLVFIDFGLGYISDKIEDVGIDMYLLERAMHNTHADFFDEIWGVIIQGYKETSPFGNEIERKILEISSRGRYSERV